MVLQRSVAVAIHDASNLYVDAKEPKSRTDLQFFPSSTTVAGAALFFRLPPPLPEHNNSPAALQ
jgi:hypothetical protein